MALNQFFGFFIKNINLKNLNFVENLTRKVCLTNLNILVLQKKIKIKFNEFEESAE